MGNLAKYRRFFKGFLRMILPEGLCVGERGVRIERDVRRESVPAEEKCVAREVCPWEWNLIDGMAVCSRGE